MQQPSSYPHPGYPPEQIFPPSMPMPYQGNPPPPQPPQTIIVNPEVGAVPTMMLCPQCRNQVVSRIEYSIGAKNHTMAAIFCIFCCIPCACIAYCLDSLKRADHYCPNCNGFLGTHNA